MRGLALVPLLALLLAGCASPSPAPTAPGPAEGLGGRPGCPAPGVLLDDDVDVATGGRDGQAVSLAEGCSLAFELDLRQLNGHVNITVTGPSGTVFSFDRTGVVTGPVEVTQDASIVNRMEPLLPGTYTYRFEADRVAQFRFQIKAVTP